MPANGMQLTPRPLVRAAAIAFVALAVGSAPACKDAGSAQQAYDPPVEPASNEGVESLATLRAAEGIELDLWAAEPMIANPVCLYVANSGEVYVAETFRHHAGVTDIRQHMDWLDDDLAATSVEEP